VIFSETKLPGTFIVELEPHNDTRGFFARAFCERELREHGLQTNFPQCNISYNRAIHTLRGMHYNQAADQEVKLVRCIAGTIYDVVIDLRPQSPTRDQWLGIELSARNRRMLYIPKGLAHGFLTLEANTEVFYHMGDFFRPGVGLGVRYNDPAFGVEWPARPSVISDRDATYPDWKADAS